MKFSVDKSDKLWAITLEENKLDARIAPDLKSEFTIMANRGVRNIVLDLSKVSFVDSSGLSAVLLGQRVCKSMGGIMVLCGVKDSVMKILQIAQLDKSLDILPTLDEAIECVFLHEIENEISLQDKRLKEIEDDFPIEEEEEIAMSKKGKKFDDEYEDSEEDEVEEFEDTFEDDEDDFEDEKPKRRRK
ncbi:MAG: STAS domain-containing protein [Bacteroidia bacterium]|nr:STAS domain-containing protein [Bacteroidia bacterium]MDW8346109.1 STAS domain-containing protein [Bacteroidia bacterium]